MKIKNVVCVATAALIMLSTASCTVDNPDDKNTTTTTAATTVQPVTTPTTTAAPTIPVRTPDKLGNMKMGTVFYKPQQTVMVYYVNTQGMSDGKVAMLRCIQGLAARVGSAEVYLSSNKDDTFWRNHISNEYGTIFTKYTVDNLIKKYLGNIKSVVVYDSSKEYQFAVAQTLAAINDGVAIDNITYTSVKKHFEKAIEKKTIEFTDLSDEITSPKQAITYTLNNLYPKALHNYIGIVDVSSPINDYLYATKSMAVSVDSEDKEQIAELKKLLNNNYTKPAVVFTEADDFEKTVSEFGFCVLNAKGFANSTFFASYSTPKKPLTIPSGADKLATPGKAYISICINTDDTDATSPLNELTENIARGNTPISININPALFELAPPIAKWYYTSRDSSTTLISIPFGYSDINTSTFDKASLESWLLTNKKFLSNTGLSIVSLNQPLSEDTIKDFADKLPVKGYLCEGIDSSEMVENIPIIKTISIDDISEFEDYKLDITEDDPLFLCISINASDLSSQPFKDLEKMVLKFQSENEGKAEFLLANDLVYTMDRYYKVKATQPTTEEISEPTTVSDEK